MRPSLVLLLLAVGCSGPPSYDPEASRAFRAAWDKRRAGDEAGYRVALAEVATKRGTWAGDRAALDLEVVDEQRVSTFSAIIRHVTARLRAAAFPAAPAVAPPAP